MATSSTTNNLLLAPKVAWPTLGLLALALLLSALGLALGVSGALPWPLAALLCAVGAYLSFTPLHEAAHRSLSRPRALNEIAGRLASLPLMAPFPALRYLHLEHHKHTNDRERDPDYYSGAGSAWLRPLRWATQDLHYYLRAARSLEKLRPAERLEAALSLFGFWGAVAALSFAGYGAQVFLYWVLPARLAIVLLAYAFDYLPHRPHAVTAAADRVRATGVFDSGLLNALLLGQSYHLIHHLYPGVPFYRYRAVWRRERARLIAAGARVWPVGPRG
jgi:beta-carotene hydroxylase